MRLDIVEGAGGLLVYRTWTLVFTTVTFLGLVLRARREEQALAAEFGEAFLRCNALWLTLQKL